MEPSPSPRDSEVESVKNSAIGFNLRSSLPKLLFESGLIVFSILLALGGNAWREQRADAALAKVALEGFRAEIEHNRDQLQKVLPYHQEVVRGLAALLESSEPMDPAASTFSMVQEVMPRGLLPPDLRSTAWETALATNALSQFDYEISYEISYEIAGTYKLQETGVASTWPRLLEVLFDRQIFRTDDRRGILLRLQAILGELVSQEQYLVSVYESALETLFAAGD